MEADVIINALGKHFEHPDVQAIVQKFGITKVPKAKADEPDSNLSAKKHGIELGFIDADYLAGKKVARYGNADMILYSATLYIKEGEPGYKEYQGTLPGGGRITDSIEEHITRLGPATEIVEDEEEGDVLSRAWQFDGYWLSFSYNWKGEFRFAGLILEEYLTLMRSK